MRQVRWAVLAAIGMSMAVPALAYDPPASGLTEQGEESEALIREQEAEAAAWHSTSKVEVAELRDGAGGMEPTDTEDADEEAAEERVQRDFLTSVWNSP